MSIIWRKVWRDLANNKLRSLLVAVSIAVGVFALGLVFGLSGLMREQMTRDHRATVPAHITFWGGPFDQAIVDELAEEPGVAGAQGEIYTSFRWKLPGETDWRDANLTARADYHDQRMNLIGLVEGDWPGENSLALERQSFAYFDVPAGAEVLIELGRRERRLPVVGALRDPLVFPPQFGGDASFYATPETLARLVGSRDYNRVSVRLLEFSHANAEQPLRAAEQPLRAAEQPLRAAEQAAQQIERRLQRAGLEVGGYGITDPEVHWLQQQLDTLFLILAVLGGLALGLSAFLIVNTMSSILAQQVWQIGVMKVVGATFSRVIRLYLAMALVYGVLACLIALPLGALAAYMAASWLLGMINIDAGEFQVVAAPVLVQVAVGLAIPLLAALVPVLAGARITPHQAISSYGLAAGFGRGRLDDLVRRIRHLPRPLILGLRNTFRRKARIALTLLTLMLGGAMFIVVLSVGSSLDNTLEVLLGDFGFDLMVGFERAYRAPRLVEIAENLPGVGRAEVWDYRRAMFLLPAGEERAGFLWGLPPDSAIFRPRIVSGRALLPEDAYAILLNSKIAADEGIQVGDEIQLSIDGRDSTWTVVGLVLNVNNNQRDSFVPFNALGRETGSLGRGSIVLLTTGGMDAAGEEQLIRALRETYTARRLKPVFFESAGDVREQNRAQFDLITYLMLFMAGLAAVVGSFGLMGTMSINVVERSREIGVMRAIGATSAAIVTIFIGEGVVVGFVSWLLAVPLSYPGARAFSQVVGTALMGVPLNFSYSLRGVALWLVLALVLSALASLWPALRAAGMRVRETLAYE
jgi:putative ABC transport system permease protein